MRRRLTAEGHLVGNSKSEHKRIQRGVPQGSCLSPTLFNIIMSDIPHNNWITIREYADDIGIIITGDTLEEVFNNAQLAILELEAWANKWCLNFNSNKTKSLCFTKRKNRCKTTRPKLPTKTEPTKYRMG